MTIHDDDKNTGRRTCFEVLFLYGTFPTVYNESTRFRQLDLLQSSGADPSCRLRTKSYFQSVSPKSDIGNP